MYGLYRLRLLFQVQAIIENYPSRTPIRVPPVGYPMLRWLLHGRQTLWCRDNNDGSRKYGRLLTDCAMSASTVTVHITACNANPIRTRLIQTTPLSKVQRLLSFENCGGQRPRHTLGKSTLLMRQTELPSRWHGVRR